MKNKLYGLTLSEIMIAVLLISISFIVITSVLISGLQSIQKSRYYTTASTIAQSKLEKIRALNDYSSVIEGIPPANDETSGNFRIDVTVREYTYDTTADRYKEVTVEVYSISDIDTSKSVRIKLDTIMAEE